MYLVLRARSPAVAGDVNRSESSHDPRVGGSSRPGTRALVLSDGGVYCIDEFNKTSDTTHSVLHEVILGAVSHYSPPLLLTDLNRKNRPCPSRWESSQPSTRACPSASSQRRGINRIPSHFNLLFLALDNGDEARAVHRELAQHLVFL